MSKTAAKRPSLLHGFSSPYAPLPPSSLATTLIGVLWQLYTIVLEPLLCHLGHSTPGGFIKPSDATYGRANIPYNRWEKELVYENPRVKHRKGKVFINEEAIARSGSRDKPSRATFVSYAVFWIPEAVEENKLNADVVLLHGINDYSGKLVPHGYHFATEGFRVTIIDLPSFGRSSGLHAYLPSTKLLTEAVYAVLVDLQAYDLADLDQGITQGQVTASGLLAGLPAEKRRLFLEGHSMGGFTALSVAAQYPPPSVENRRDSTGLHRHRPIIHGVAVAAPMIGISPESRPLYFVELFARFLRSFLGRLPLATAVRGNVSDDPRVEDEFYLDPMTYKGRLRIATGLAILEGLRSLDAGVEDIHVPVCIHHGTKDRATSYRHSQRFFERLPANPRHHLRLWDGYEHVMMKNVKGQSKEDDEKRDAVLNAITEWLVALAKESHV